MKENVAQLYITKNRMTQLLSLQYGSAIISFLGIIIITTVFHEHITSMAKVWFLINTVIFLTRVSLVYKFKKKLVQKELSLNSIDRIEFIYAFFLLLTGIGWGLILHIFASAAPRDLLLFLPFAPIAALMGGSLNLLLSPKSALSFSSGILFSLASYFLLDSSLLLISGVFAGSIIIAATIYITSKKNLLDYEKTQNLILEKSKLLKIAEENLLLEEELKSQKAQMAQKNKMASLGEMAEGIAHEVNNPLAIIHMNLESITKLYERGIVKSEKIMPKIDSSLETVNRISNIVRGLLLFSSRDEEDKKQKISLQSIINESLMLTNEKLKMKNIDLKVNIDDHLCDYLIEVDQKLIQEVITNLINNSYYFIKDDKAPWIEIKLTQENQKVSLSITDSGQAIKKEIQSKIFDPFFSTKVHGDGTGLGLSTSRGIIESFDGELTLIDTAHPSFLISLPIAA